jgi:hypothetical protein
VSPAPLAVTVYFAAVPTAALTFAGCVVIVVLTVRVAALE